MSSDIHSGFEEAKRSHRILDQFRTIREVERFSILQIKSLTETFGDERLVCLDWPQQKDESLISLFIDKRPMHQALSVGKRIHISTGSVVTFVRRGVAARHAPNEVDRCLAGKETEEV